MKHPLSLNLVLGFLGLANILPMYTRYQTLSISCTFFLLPSTSKILLLFGDVCTAVDETPIQTTLGPWVLTKHIGTRDRILSQSHPKSLSPEFGQSPKVPKEIWDEARSQLRVRLREIEDGKQVQTVQSLQRFL